MAFPDGDYAFAVAFGDDHGRGGSIRVPRRLAHFLAGHGAFFQADPPGAAGIPSCIAASRFINYMNDKGPAASFRICAGVKFYGPNASNHCQWSELSRSCVG